MRKLMWFTLGFGAACAVSAYFMNANAPLAVIIGCLIAAAGFMVLGGDYLWLKPAGAVMLGIAVAFVWIWIADWNYLADARGLDGQTMEMRLEASDYSYATGYGQAVDAQLSYNGNTYQVKVYYNTDTHAQPGDTISGTFRFHLTLKSDEREATYHQGKGIFLLAYGNENVTISSGKVQWIHCPAILRQKVLTLIDTAFPKDTAFFARALLLGDTTGIDYATDTAFKLSGIRHIIAVSGLHVSILFSLLYQFVRKNRFLTSMLCIPALILFAAVAGFSASVTRACIMQILMMLALVLNREYDPPTALSFAALIMLFGNPLAITDIGFQLSVGCMAGIFLFSEPIKAWLLDQKRLDSAKGNGILPRLKRWFSSSVSISLSATTLTAPLSAIHFGTVSLIGILTNLITLWLVTYVFYGILLVCIAGLIFPLLGRIFAIPVSWLIRFILFAARTLAKFPLAAVYTASPYIVAWIIFAYLLFGLFLIRRQNALHFSCAVILSLILAVGASWVEPTLDDLRVTVLDVGQGQCVLLQSEGKAFLVDCGGDSDVLAADTAAEALLSQGIDTLDGLILTHYDADHAGGAKYLASRITIRNVFLPPKLDAEGIGISLYQALDQESQIVEEDLLLTYGTSKLTIFAPGIGETDNETGLCVLFQAANCDILITGDRSIHGERQLLKQYDLPQLELLVAGHHGSKTSTGEELLSVTHPAVVVISVGDNSYGHPSDETLARLAAYGCIVYRTDEQGTILFRR